jgi:LacI family transcriptional regulator
MENVDKNSEAEPGKRRKVTIYDVAREAGVSFVTVSRAFNNHKHVSEATKGRIFEVARQLGYRSRLVTRPKSITLITPQSDGDGNLDDMTLMRIYLSQHAEKHDMLCRCVSIDNLPELVKYGTDGIIEAGLESFTLKGRKDIPNIPVVLTQKRSEDPHWCSVTVDYQREAREALEHVLSKGHTNVGVLLPALDRWTVRHRLNGLAEARMAYGLERGQVGIFSSSVLSLPELDGALRSSGRTCLISFDSNNVMQILDYFFNQSSRRIPEDLSLLMLDNLGITGHYHPRVCSIRQHLKKIAHNAVEHIVNPDQEGKEKHTLIPSSLEPGNTCVPLP